MQLVVFKIRGDLLSVFCSFSGKGVFLDPIHPVRCTRICLYFRSLLIDELERTKKFSQ